MYSALKPLPVLSRDGYEFLGWYIGEEKVTSITRREELLSMLIVLKQDNRQIAELMAIAPRSVLMLRHRLRQKIGMNTEHSLENFIEELLI